MMYFLNLRFEIDVFANIAVWKWDEASQIKGKTV
jgi:hypothetical protein